MGVSFVLSRLLVGFEFFLGVALSLNRWNRLIDAVVLFVLSSFSVFLIYLVAVGDEGNCHCFGEVVDFSPTESLIKNALLLVFLFFSSRSVPFGWRYANLLIPALLLFSLAAPFVVDRPENMMEDKRVSYDGERLSVFLEKGEVPAGLRRGKKILCFYSTSCSHCRIAARKMDIIMDKYGIPDSLSFWGIYDPKGKMEEFISESGIRRQKSVFLDSEIFAITEGRLPLILLMEDGGVVEMMSNQTLSEEKVSSFVRDKSLSR